MRSRLENIHHSQYGTGKGYKSKVNRKKNKGSSTPGKSKGSNCQATPEDKGMARHNRAYRSHREEYQRFRKRKDYWTVGK